MTIETTKTITLAPTCMVCRQPIARPADAQWELFRAGYHVHATEACIAGFEAWVEQQSKRR